MLSRLYMEVNRLLSSRMILKSKLMPWRLKTTLSGAMRPKEVIAELDKYIVGQPDAKVVVV
jgi:ATP-dependent protease Clp ATPase subunit